MIDSKLAALKKAIEVIEQLRHPEDGCPWDLKQTHETLTQYLVEESYEYSDSVHHGTVEQQKDELGDILLQVILNSIIAEQEGKYNLADVAEQIADKMVRRHPHVFDESQKGLSIEQIKENWKNIKRAEKEESGQSIKYRIDKDVLSFPALISADKIGKKTSRINFDWDDALQVTYKVEEEWQELKEEVYKGENPNREAVEEELGDFLFSVAQLARHLDFNPEETLRKANIKFLKRFNLMEEVLEEENLILEDLNQEKLDYYWGVAKRKHKETLRN